MRYGFWLAGLVLLLPLPARAADDPALARAALAILDKHCHRCHGQDGAVEGGMNFILDRDKLIARKKIIPGSPEQSPLFRRMSTGKMPPADVQPRPTEDDIATIKRWIQGGASAAVVNNRKIVTEAEAFEWMLSDLEKIDRRARRFVRYFSLLPLANAGASQDEMQTFRNALSKLVNSLSWHPKISVPRPIDPDGLILRIDLRDYQWDANLWNRLLNEYPYGTLHDTGTGRAVLVATGTRMPVVRADWFVATASRAPLYYDMLQMPTNLAELERQLRVDVALDIQQERVARAGFIGSGISRNNRILERHDAQNGVYWRTYDFDAVQQNLVERDLLLPDRRNAFAYPLGPGQTDNTFLHAGGEAIFDLPNGLHGYILINANNVRLDKGPIQIVSDPKRPDRAVEAGVSCMGCHITGILPKDDMIRDHVGKNPKAFSRQDAELIRALYLPKDVTRAKMDDDAKRYQKALAATGNRVSANESVTTITLRYESDVDLPTLAAELGIKPEALLARLTGDSPLARNLGALRVAEATVARQVVVQAFADIVRELRLGVAFRPGNVGQILPDNTGELDPLEAQSAPANAVAFSPGGQLAAFASADKTVVIFDVASNRELRRCIGHTASVWAVAFSPDGSRILSGGKDGTVRLWDVENGRELQRMEGHLDLVTSVCFSPDGKTAISTSLDHEAIRWNLERGTRIDSFTFPNGQEGAKYLEAVTFTPDGEHIAIAGRGGVFYLDETGKVVKTFPIPNVRAMVFSANGKTLLTGSDDWVVRLWDVEKGTELKKFTGHTGPVVGVALRADGKYVASAGADATVRLWDVEKTAEMKAFGRHGEPVVNVIFLDNGRKTLSASRDANVLTWSIDKLINPVVIDTNPNPGSGTVTRPIVPPAGELRPTARLEVGGTLTNVLLSPNGKWAFYLNVTAGKLARIEVDPLRRDKVVDVPPGTEVVRLSPDGKSLVAMTTTKPTGKLLVLDPVTLQTRREIPLEKPGYDLALANDKAYVSGNDDDWSEVKVFDLASGKLLNRHAGVWTQSLIELAADGKRLYHSSQGVTPGTLEALYLGDRPEQPAATGKAPQPGRQPLGGDFFLSPDGTLLLFRSGTALRLSTEREQDMRFHAALEPFIHASFDAERKLLFVLSREGTLDVYSYPDLKLRASKRLDLLATRLVVSPATGKLLLAGVDPRTLADRPRARGMGDVYSFDLKDIIGGK
jgi:WD40 repeat protein/mono/diheme cytochrome c family protein